MSSVSERRILITGGAGFIGGHLAERLAADQRNQLVLVDNFARGRRDELIVSLERQPNVRIIVADLTDPATYRALGQGYDEVYHLAGIVGVRNVVERPHEVLRVNALCTASIVDWCIQGGGARLLFASTSEVYAWTQQFHELPVPTPEDVPLALTDLTNPRSCYAASKIYGELLVTQGCGRVGRPFAIVRYHNVYGPRMGFDHVMPELYQRAVAGQNPLVVYSADYQRAFCYVSDAVDATIAAMRLGSADPSTFNIGNDTAEVTIAELARSILAWARIDAQVQPAPAANDPIRRRVPDISRARELLGYRPRVSLNEGLAKTLAWYAMEASREAYAAGV